MEAINYSAKDDKRESDGFYPFATQNIFSDGVNGKK